MSTIPTPPQNDKSAIQLEPTSARVHNACRASQEGNPDRRIVALVKLLARFAAEEDFREDQHEG